MKKTSLYQKIHNVMEKIEYLEKDKTIIKGQSSYNVISEEKVTKTVREILIEQGLIILVIDQQVKTERFQRMDLATNKPRYEFYAEVLVKYKIIDIVTGESEIIMSSGTGIDSGDKAIGKAMTYALKYLFLRNFLIPTGDDPDQFASENIQAPNNQKEIDYVLKLQELIPHLSKKAQSEIFEVISDYKDNKISLTAIQNYYEKTKQAFELKNKG